MRKTCPLKLLEKRSFKRNKIKDRHCFEIFITICDHFFKSELPYRSFFDSIIIY